MLKTQVVRSLLAIVGLALSGLLLTPGARAGNPEDPPGTIEANGGEGVAQDVGRVAMVAVSSLPAPSATGVSGEPVEVHPPLTPAAGGKEAADSVAPPSGVSVPVARGPEGLSPSPLSHLTFTQSFDGLAYTDNSIGWRPPDPMVAAGPDHVFEVVNTMGRIWTKTGVTVTTFPLSTFFAMPTDVFRDIFDPKILYDSGSGRFFVASAAFSATIATGREMLAVSNTSDPTGSWTTYAYTYTGSYPFWDFPGLGVCDDKLVLSANMFNAAGTSYGGAQFRVWQKSQLLAGAAAISTTLLGADASYFTIQPAQHFGSSSTCYMADVPYVSSGDAASTDVNVHRVTGTPLAADVSRSVATTTTANSTKTPPGAAQLGTGTLISTNDNRVLGTVWQVNRLWLFGHTACTVSSLARSCIYYRQVNTTDDSVVSESNYTYGTFFCYFPAMTLVPGNALLLVSCSDSSVYSRLYVGSVRNDGTLGDGQLLKAGNVSYPTTRWGDYSGASRDPVDPNTAWVVGEYPKATGSGGSATVWGTYLGAFSASGSARLFLPLTLKAYAGGW